MVGPEGEGQLMLAGGAGLEVVPGSVLKIVFRDEPVPAGEGHAQVGLEFGVFPRQGRVAGERRPAEGWIGLRVCPAGLRPRVGHLVRKFHVGRGVVEVRIAEPGVDGHAAPERSGVASGVVAGVDFEIAALALDFGIEEGAGDLVAVIDVVVGLQGMEHFVGVGHLADGDLSIRAVVEDPVGEHIQPGAGVDRFVEQVG